MRSHCFADWWRMWTVQRHCCFLYCYRLQWHSWASRTSEQCYDSKCVINHSSALVYVLSLPSPVADAKLPGLTAVLPLHVGMVFVTLMKLRVTVMSTVPTTPVRNLDNLIVLVPVSIQKQIGAIVWCVRDCLSSEQSAHCWKVFYPTVNWLDVVPIECYSTGGWVVTENGLNLRFVVEDSVNCGGTNNIEQSGTATAEIILSEPHIILPLTLQESPD